MSEAARPDLPPFPDTLPDNTGVPADWNSKSCRTHVGRDDYPAAEPFTELTAS